MTITWRQIAPYIELIGMTGILIGDDSLEPRQQSHLRKMISVQYAMVPKRRSGLRAQEFLQEVQNQAGDEIAESQSLPEDLQKMPPAWRNAYADTLQIQSDLFIEPEHPSGR